jgi:hypothetical protein
LGTVWTRFTVTPEAVVASSPQSGFTTLDMLPGPATTQPLPNGAKSWKRDVRVCFAIAQGSIFSSCMTTLFDTGAESGITFETEDASEIPTVSTHCGSILKPEKRFSAEAPGADGKVLTAFLGGATQNWNEVHVVTPKPSATPQVNTGITFYNRNEISFDAVHGRVGLKALDPPAHNFESSCSPGD